MAMNLIYLFGSFIRVKFWIFIISGSIFALLYANLIILCKYTVIFINKTVNKESLTQNEIYYLITSLIIFVTVGVVLTPMYSSETDLLTTFAEAIPAYIISLLIFSVMIIGTLVTLNFSNLWKFIWLIPLTILMGANIIILCKYLYRFIRKTIKKEFPTQKEIIYLTASIIIFFAIGIILAPGFRSL